MNASQIVSIVLKLLLLGSGALLALGWITPEQQAQLNEALAGLGGSITSLVTAALVVYSIIRSIKTHKDK